MSLAGFSQLQGKLKTLPKTVARKLLRQAVTAGQKPVIAAAKATAPKRTGALKRSIGSKVSVSAGKQSAAAIIGARRKAEPKKGRTVKPSRYLHLAEKRRPFLNAALARNKSEAGRIVADKLAAGIDAAATS